LKFINENKVPKYQSIDQLKIGNWKQKHNVIN